ncbi:MAG: PDZ domain-containing protein [Planctomycetota bacterium]
MFSPAGRCFPWFVLVVLLSWTSLAHAADPIEYTLRFPEPHTHYVEVDARFPTELRKEITVRMATWTPGSYLIREFARHIEDVEVATEGSSVEKVAKNRWRIRTGGAKFIDLKYRVYCREMSVRTNWVEAEFAVLNGAPTFLTLLDPKPRPHRVAIELAEGWRDSVTGLPPAPGGSAHHYEAANYDQLVDSPILLGTPALYEFEIAGKKHVLANQGEGGVWDGAQSVDDVKKIVEENLRLWGHLPYERYVFLNLISESGGGLEHSNSTLMMTSRWRARVPDEYRGWLGLVSHEFFHTWNVKRLRPIELGPFDYENEVYTESLWVAEGITSYYDDLMLARTGIAPQKKYLEAMSKNIKGVETTPGRRVRPLSVASYDAWIKHYRPDENSRNTNISYYTKGAVVSFLLDMRVREATNDTKSLDDVLRLAYERYSGERGFEPDEFYACATEVAGVDLRPWFAHHVESAEELDYGPALAWLGLRFKNPETKKDEPNGAGANDETDPTREAKAVADAEPEDPKPIPGWLGLITRVDNGRLLVRGLRRGTPAHAQGFNVGDEILAIDDYRVPPSGWAKRLRQYRPGDEATILIARREKLMRLAVTFAEEPKDRWKLAVDPNATDEQKERLDRWLGPTRPIVIEATPAEEPNGR